MAVLSTITLPDGRVFMIHDPEAMLKSGGTFLGRVYGIEEPESDNEFVTKSHVDTVVNEKEIYWEED